MHCLTIYDIGFAFSSDSEFSSVAVAAVALETRNYRPLYRSLIRSAAEVFGLENFTSQPSDAFRSHEYGGDESESIFPEIFAKDGYLFSVSLFPKHTRIVAIRHHDAKSPAPDFEKDLIECIHSEADGRRTKNWTPVLPSPALCPFPRIRNSFGRSDDRFSELSLNPATITEIEKQMTALLAEQRVRTPILSIARSGKTKISDAEKDLTIEQIEELKKYHLLK